MVNVRIKVTGRAQDGVLEHATGKVFLRASEVDGYPPLLPGEVVALDDREASDLLGKLFELEMTTAAPTRESPPPLNGSGAPVRAKAPASDAKDTRIAQLEAELAAMKSKDKPAPRETKEPTEADEARAAEILAAFDAVDVNLRRNKTATGLPNKAAVQAVLGYEIERGDYTAAMLKFNSR